jgi:hypothetical protein
MSNKIYVQIDDVKKELTGQELDDFLADKVICDAELVTLAAEAEATATAKAALLDRLGITAEEAVLLFS